MIAAVNGNMQIVEMLLEAGSNPDAMDKYGDTALDKAAYWAYKDIFDYLLIFAPNLEGKEYLQEELAKGILR